jgi:hypothetical protein
MGLREINWCSHRAIRKLMTNKHRMLLAIVALLGACSIHSSGVVSRGEGRYNVTHLSGSPSASTDSLKADAIEEGDAYCAQKQRRLKLIHSKDTPLGSFGQWAESEVEFVCE